MDRPTRACRQPGRGRAAARAEARACELGLTRLFRDTCHARALDAAHGFVEVAPFSPPGRFEDHWFEKHHIGSAR